MSYRMGVHFWVSTVITAKRATIFVSFTWLALFGINIWLATVCCPLIPLPEYYTFDYDNPNNEHNFYPDVFIPIEVSSMIALVVLNPITIGALIRLQRKQKVKPTSKFVSVIPMPVIANRNEPSTAAGQKKKVVAIQNEPSTIGNRNEPSTAANRNQKTVAKTAQNNARKQLIAFVQMGLVMLVFLIYMFWYYLFFYFIGMTTKWETMMNSLFYTINNMINPFVYFVFRPKMREELVKILTCGRYS